MSLRKQICRARRHLDRALRDIADATALAQGGLRVHLLEIHSRLEDADQSLRDVRRFLKRQGGRDG